MLQTGTRVRHAAEDTATHPRGHRAGIIRSVDPDGLVTVEWHEVAAYLQPLADSERARTGAYTGRFHPSLLVAISQASSDTAFERYGMRPSIIHTLPEGQTPMVTYGTLRSYRDGVAAGLFDQDLDDDGRWQTVRLLDFALLRVQYANLPARDLFDMVRDPMTTPATINARVRDIIEGCAQ